MAVYLNFKSMPEEEVFVVNDTTRMIRDIQKDLKERNWEKTDQRIKAMILTKLEEAELLTFRLIKN